jgi:hypothetical protein
MKSKLNRFVLLSLLGGTQMCFVTEYQAQASSGRFQGNSSSKKSDREEKLYDELDRAINNRDYFEIQRLLGDRDLNINFQQR